MYDKTLRFLPKLPNYPQITKIPTPRIKTYKWSRKIPISKQEPKKEDGDDSPNSKVLQINNRSD